jgi:integrase
MSFVGFELEVKMPKMLANRLTAIGVEKLKKPGCYCDGANLWLQITKTGVKSWLFRYMRGGVAKNMGFGPVLDTTLEDAREKAREARKMLKNDIDPCQHKKDQKAAKRIAEAKVMTFDQCAAKYIKSHRAGWKNLKHAQQWENTLATYASPVFGKLPVAEIDTGLIEKCLAPIWESKHETASRLRGRIESILGWAKTSGYRTGDNPAAWKGHLENLLAKINKSSKVVHHPALPYSDIAEFMVQLRQQEGTGARALEFAILTAARSNEVRGATWSEIDMEKKEWTIPKSRMKAGKEHSVPLSDEAVDLLKKLPRFEDCEIVFPSPRLKHFSDAVFSALLDRMGRKDITAHGFRSTFRQWGGDVSTIEREVLERALAHRLKDAGEAAYDRGLYWDKRGKAMQSWANYCYAKPGKSNVVQIQQGAA